MYSEHARAEVIDGGTLGCIYRTARWFTEHYEELFEVITWSQLGIHQKPIGILNVAGYFDPMLELVERGIEEEFIRPQYRNLILVSENPEDLLDRMETFGPIEGVTKWIDLVKS